MAQGPEPCTHVENPGVTPSFWLWPGPALAIANIWRMSQLMEDLSVSISLSMSLSNKQIILKVRENLGFFFKEK